MKPQIQYAKTSDGVNIAFAVIGEGPPVVYVGSFGGGVHFQTHFPTSGRTDEGLAALGWRIIRYDAPGTGSSDREVDDFALEMKLLDVDAVVDHLGLDRFALGGHGQGALVALGYAATRPERVSRMVLWRPIASGTDVYRTLPHFRALTALRPLAMEHWELVSFNYAHLAFGVLEPELATEMAAAIQSGITPEAWVANDEAVEKTDLGRMLDRIDVPVLISLRSPGSLAQAAGWEPSIRKLASAIRGARQVDHADAAMTDAFLREAEAGAPAPVGTAAPTSLRTVLFTDLVGHTEMMSRLGDERGRAVLREHERITRGVLKAHGGAEVKTMGDGFMASFGSVTKAVECAVALQRAFAERKGEPLSVRVGLNAGEPIEEDGDLFGATVILASRIAARAEGGEVLVSDNVRSLCTGKGFLFADRGEFVAKGFEEPVRVYEVRWRE